MSHASLEKGTVVLRDGRHLAVERDGAAHGGTPVLLIRPLGGTMSLWGPFREVLASRAPVIAFDRGGAGESSDAPLGATTRGMAADAVAVLDHFHATRAHVFGISLGGMVASWLAIDAPERVDRLCLASTPDAGLDLSRTAAGRGVSIAGCLFGPADRIEACLARRILSEPFRAQHPERVAHLQLLAGREPARRRELLKQLAAAALHRPGGALGKIRGPALILAGDRDELLGHRPQEALARAIPGARLEVVPGAGHDLTLEHPLLVARRVGSFFFGDEEPS
jgi:3-oxoadipate enol-lactonase